MAALAALLTLFVAPRAQAQSFDQLLPADTIVYVSIENTGRTKTRFKNCSLSSLWSHEEMKGFLKVPMEKWTEAVEEMKKTAGFSVEDVLDLASGQIVVAAHGINFKKEEPKGLVILADIGDKAARVRELAAAGEKRFGDKFRRTEEEFRGVTIVVYRPENEEAEDIPEEGAESKEQPCWFVHENLFALAPSPETLKKLIARREAGSEGSLAERELYKRARARTGRSPDLCVWVDGPNIIDALRKAKVLDDDAWRIGEALGLTAIEGICLQGRLAPDGLFMDLFIPVRGEKRGVLKLFDSANDITAPPKWVPPDAIVAGTMHLDLNAIYKEALRVAEAIEEGSAQQVEAGLAQVKAMTGVDIKQDILGSFGNTFTSYMKAPDPNAPGAMVPGVGGDFSFLQQAVVALGVTNQQALEGAFTKLLAMAPQQMVQESTYLGIKLRTITALQPMGVAPTFAVLPDQLVFGMRADDVRELIARYGKEGKTLAESERFKRAIEGMPAERISISYEDVARSIRHNSAVQVLQLVPDLKGVLDMDRFPSEETLKQFLGDGAGVMSNEEDGILYRSRIRLKPKTTDDE